MATRDIKRLQPQWLQPTPSSEQNNLPKLKLYNSLTGKKDIFVPRNDNKVTWYACGPTVYDAAHMGHARCYISMDIIRRVLKYYFLFDVHQVMNITDIDDKIIKRARQNYLIEQYTQRARANLLPRDTVVNDINECLQNLEAKILTESDTDKQQMYRNDVQRIRKALEGNESGLEGLLEGCGVVLGELLGNRKEEILKINDNSIFDELPDYWEQQFHEDMKALNILPADQKTNVRSFIPQIIDYVQKLIDNGFAYSSGGSVYFDTQTFACDPNHFYAKLVPTAYGDQEALEAGEGDIFLSGLQDKHSNSDFALWKASKPGEPSWKSPWGDGRPGWHIECSVMASETLGRHMDIHSGGVDLKFPHHDNEMAQTEAFYGHSDWVRYFLHSGHLTIHNCKMSKSLKNFITIRQCLTQDSPERLRLAFLLHSWKDTLDYSTETMKEALSYEKMLADYFFIVYHYINHWVPDGVSLSKAMQALTSEAADDGVAGDEEHAALQSHYSAMRQRIDDALRDSIDTRETLNVVRDFIGRIHALQQRYPDPTQIDRDSGGHGDSIIRLLHQSAVFISWLFQMFGCHSQLLEPLPLESNHPTTLGAHIVRYQLDQCDDRRHAVDSLMGIINVARQFQEKVDAIIQRESMLEAMNRMGDDFAESVDGARRLMETKYFQMNEEDVGQYLLEVAGSECNGRHELSELTVCRDLLNIMSKHRTRLRTLALEERKYVKTQHGKKAPLPPWSGELLQVCDWLRNDALPMVKVRLDDCDAGPAAVCLVNPRLYAEDRQQKSLQYAEKENLKKEKQQRVALATIPPSRYFSERFPHLYSQFNDEGLPTHAADGSELSSKVRRKLTAELQAHKKLYQKHRALQH